VTTATVARTGLSIAPNFGSENLLKWLVETCERPRNRSAAEERDELAPLNVNPSGVVPPSMSIGLGFPRLGQRPKSSSASRLTAAQVRVLRLEPVRRLARSGSASPCA
jgi:hypothetical protein